jgi:hypothetical protein
LHRSDKPVLVTGSHRSGTTWVGQTLALHPRVGYVHEPFHAGNPNPLVGLRPENWFEYVPGSPRKEDFRRKLDWLLGATPLQLAVRRTRAAGLDARTPLRFLKHLALETLGSRPLFKDPLALLSAGWLHERYDFEVVCMIRDPLAFVGSLKKAGWSFDFHDLARQEELMRDVLFPFRQEILRACDEPGDVVDEGVLLWNVLHFVILGYRERYPSWTFVKYEDLAVDPVSGFRYLYKRLGLQITPEIEDVIGDYTSSRNPVEASSAAYGPRDAKASLDNWKKRLSPEEVDRVRRGTRELAASLYGDGIP